MAEHLATERLILRRWRNSDREPFAALNAAARVMEFMPRRLPREASDRLIDGIERHFEEHRFGLYAAELRVDASFAGFIGLSIPAFPIRGCDAAFAPAVEIGWRLAVEYWGRGLASEGAREALRHGFETLRLDHVVSFTVPANIRSRRVMERLNMTCDPADDFEHPDLPEGHVLRPHVLYRLSRTEWQAGR